MIKKTCKFIGNIIFYTLVISVIVIGLIMVRSNINGEIPNVLGYRFYIVLTGSMEPTIDVGDIVIVKEILKEQVEVNEIITFRSKNTRNITTHRAIEIINISGDIKYITKGDANNVQDPSLVDGELLVGKVVKVIPRIGIIIGWIKKNLKIILVIVVATFILIRYKKIKLFAALLFKR